MAKHANLNKAHTALTKYALTFPEAWEDFPWGHSAVKVKAKIFLSVHIHEEEGWLSLSVKLPLSGKTALLFPFAQPSGYGLGKSGWVTSRFAEADDIPLDMLEAWIDESYRAVAPKKVLAAMEQSEERAEEKPNRVKKGKK